MANRPKTERNKTIMHLWEKGWRQKSIANMLKMKESAVSMVIWREYRRRGTCKQGPTLEGCIITAISNGHTKAEAKLCDDGAVGCPNCPFKARRLRDETLEI